MRTRTEFNSDSSNRLDNLMRPHQIWANVSSHTNGDSDVEMLEADEVILRRVFDAFVSQIGIETWLQRRDAIEAEYQAFSAASIGLVDVPIFWLEDTFGWYLYLCELTIARPYESPTYYSSRVLPFLGAIGGKLHYRASVRNLDAKLLATATERKREPDGLIFEILVALSYAERGFTVEFIPEGSARTPDMRVEMHGHSFLVECKRMSSRSQYAVEEERLWRKQWEVAEPVVKNVSQWVWLDVVIHVELSTLEPDWLARKLETLLPIPGDFTQVDDDQGTIRARLVDRRALDADLAWSSLKLSGSKLRHLLGGDWVPENAMTALSIHGPQITVGEKPGYFATYIPSVDRASGATFSCDAEASIERKARDVRAHVARAVQQVPNDELSVLHVAFETLEGPGVENRRLQKVIRSVESMTSMKMVAGIILHSLQPVDSTGQAIVIDETSSDFWRLPDLREFVPLMVVLPASHGLQAREGNHWD